MNSEMKTEMTGVCRHCLGTGLVLRGDTFKCPSNTHTSLTKTCMYCENANKSRYVECYACMGTGRSDYAGESYGATVTGSSAVK